MKRRSLLKAAVLGSGAAFAAPAIAKGLMEWRMVTSWPRGLPGLGTGAERLAANITAMSGGRLTIKVYSAGELVPALECFGAVANGTAQMGHDAAYYHTGKSEGCAFFTAFPFGFTMGEMAGVDQARQRPETLGRTLRAVRRPRFPGGQHGHADVRLVPA